MEDLISQYKETLMFVREAKKRSVTENDRKLFESMDGSLRFSITKMGRYTNEHLEAADTRYVLIEPNKLNNMIGTDPIENLFTEDEQQAKKRTGIDLRFLSHRELTALTLYLLDGWTYAEIAEHMHVHPGSVVRYLKRARAKLIERYDLGVQTTLLSTGDEDQDGSYLSGMTRKPREVHAPGTSPSKDTEVSVKRQVQTTLLPLKTKA
jgi:predicted DNA-binding protein (UPF0251 family)